MHVCRRAAHTARTLKTPAIPLRIKTVMRGYSVVSLSVLNHLVKPRKQVHGNGVNTIQYTQAVHAMRTLLILVATFTCLVSFGSFVILYLLPTTSIWKDVNHIQVVTWDSWLL